MGEAREEAVNSRPERICEKCGKKYAPTGQRQKYCRDCSVLARNERLASEKYIAYRRGYQRKYRRKHKTERRVYERDYYRAHPEKQKARSAKWYAAHSEERRQFSRDYRREFPDKVRETKRKYNRSHPEVIKRQTKRRYLRVKERLARLAVLEAQHESAEVRLAKLVEARMPRVNQLCANKNNLNSLRPTASERDALHWGRFDRKIVARYLVSLVTKYKYDTVALAHRKFLANGGK
jgi:hypothetical protein